MPALIKIPETLFMSNTIILLDIESLILTII